MAKKNTKTANYLWTKEAITKLVRLWKSKNLDDIVEEMGLPKHAIKYMAAQIRKERPELMPKKRAVGRTNKLIKEVLANL